MASGSVSQTLGPEDVVNNLTSTATDKPLSAAQGLALATLSDFEITGATGITILKQNSVSSKNGLCLIQIQFQATSTIANGIIFTISNSNLSFGDTFLAGTIINTNNNNIYNVYGRWSAITTVTELPVGYYALTMIYHKVV